MLTTLLIGDVWGQQPKRPTEPLPAPLLPLEQAWSRDLRALPAAGGALDSQHVYIPLQDGGTLALKRESGEPAWTNPLGTPWPPLTSPRGLIVITTDEAAAMEPRSGDTLWRVPLMGRSIAPGLLTADHVVIALESGSLIALRATDGAIAWSTPIEGLAPPVGLAADASTVYVTTDGSRVTAVTSASGQIRWQQTLDGVLSSPATGKDRVFVGSTSNAFYGLDSTSGKQEWVWGPTMIGGDVIGAAVEGDLTFFVGLDNLLHAVNRNNGNQRWKQPTPMRPIAPPQAFGGIVAVFGVSPAIATFNARTGAASGTYSIPAVTGATTAPAPKGAPLIDADLRPFKVAAVVITTDGRAIGLRPVGMMFRESPLTPFTELPGRQLPRERLPTVTTKP